MMRLCLRGAMLLLCCIAWTASHAASEAGALRAHAVQPSSRQLLDAFVDQPVRTVLGNASEPEDKPKRSLPS